MEPMMDSRSRHPGRAQGLLDHRQSTTSSKSVPRCALHPEWCTAAGLGSESPDPKCVACQSQDFRPAGISVCALQLSVLGQAVKREAEGSYARFTRTRQDV